MLPTLCAIDENGGQALFVEEGAWYRVALDNGWRPITLRDERDAMRCTQLGPYQVCQVQFATREALVKEVRERYLGQVDEQSVPLERILHRCPSKLRSNPVYAQGFDTFIKNNPVLTTIREFAKYYTQSDHSEVRTDEVFDYTLDEIRKNWETMKSWKAFARTVAWRQAARLRKHRPTIERNAGVAGDLDAMAEDGAAPPDQLVIDREERDYIRNALAGLPIGELEVLDAFANAKSGREAARSLGMPESTYRSKLYAIISKVQPKSA